MMKDAFIGELLWDIHPRLARGGKMRENTVVLAMPAMNGANPVSGN